MSLLIPNIMKRGTKVDHYQRKLNQVLPERGMTQQ